MSPAPAPAEKSPASLLLAKWRGRKATPSDFSDQIDRLFSRERVFDFNAELVASNGGPPHVSLLLEGFAASYKLLSNGRRQITALYVSGDLIDLHGVVLSRMVQGVFALSPGRLIQGDPDQLRALAHRSPDLCWELWRDTLVGAEISREWLVSMGRRSSLGHLAHFICELYARLSLVGRTDGYTFALPLTQSDLADVLGLSMVHVNRIIKTLRSENVMTWGGQAVTILNWERLCDIGEFDRGYLGIEPEHPVRTYP